MTEPVRGGADGDAVEQLRHKGSQLQRDVRELGTLARQAAQEKLGEARDAAGQYVEQGREKTQQLARTVEDYIRQQPIKSVLIAAGAGAVLGVLLARR
jgi:ElaB/YqjD/DUF883 family membrane-anchored ribosome-binding protein